MNRLNDLSPQLCDQLDEALGVFLTKAAIDTSSRYMLEFNNEIDQQWLFKFKNYSASGFAEGTPEGTGRWTDWLEAMINTDTQTIQVLMNPPKALLRGRSVNTDNRVRLEYMHELEPRKIANQLLNVRSSITTEMIQDLGCIQTENVEAVRYAQAKMVGGAAAAVERKLTRMDESGGESTPLRDRNYLECGIIITNFALEKVRGDLNKQRNEAGLGFLDGIIEQLARRDEERSVLDRILHEFYQPRELIEEVYLQGLQQGITSGSQLNTLAIAENLLQTRFFFSLEANRIMLEQDRFARNYYKLIKDKGGFLLWKQTAGSPRAKVKIIDLNADESIRANAVAKVANTLGMKSPQIGLPSDATAEVNSSKSETGGKTSSSTSTASAPAAPAEADAPPPPEIDETDETAGDPPSLSDFGSIGPFFIS